MRIPRIPKQEFATELLAPVNCSIQEKLKNKIIKMGWVRTRPTKSTTSYASLVYIQVWKILILRKKLAWVLACP